MDRLLDTNVRYFDNNVTTAQLKNERGSLVKILDEVLVTGSSEKDILSITTIEDPNDSRYWLSTVVLPDGNNYKTDLTVVLISNSSEPNYNTVFRVQESGNNYIKIAFDKTKVPTKPANITTGAKIKIAPLGYIKAFSATNKAVYKSVDPDFNCYLRVDDSLQVGYDPSWTKYAMVSIYSDMIDIDDYYPRDGRLKAPYYADDPLIAEVPNGTGDSGRYGESKWFYATNDYSVGFYLNRTPSGNGPYGWELIGDSKTFYFFPSLIGYHTWYQKPGYCFGKYIDMNEENNKYNCILCCHEARARVNELQFGHYTSNPGRAEGGNVFARRLDASGKYILNNLYTEENLNPHAKVEFFGGPVVISGRDTGISYNQYQTNLNFFEVFMKGLYPQKATFLGKMRGYHWIGNNLQENKLKYPIFRSVVSDIKNNKSEKMYLQEVFISWAASDQWDGWQYGRIAFKLSNWE